MMKSQRFSLATAALLVMAASAAPASAQPGAQPGNRPRPQVDQRNGRPDPGQVDNPRRAARRERVRQRIRAMRAWYLTEQLELDDATSARLFPVLVRFDDRIDELHQRGVQLRRALRREMAATRPDRVALDRMVDGLLAHYEAVYRVQRERFAAVRKVVTPAQSAKLLLLLPRVDDAIRRQIQRAMGGRKGSRGGRVGGDDVDDPFPLGRRKNRAGRGRPADDDPPFADPF